MTIPLIDRVRPAAMDTYVNRFKRGLVEKRRQFGAWLTIGSPSTAEALGFAGYDFLVVDMEHTPLETHHMVDTLRAIGGTPASAVVRLPWNDMVMIKRALDGGAQTVLMPFVQNAHEARLAVSYTRYPPNGVRGVSGMQRGNRYGAVKDYFKTGHDQLCVMVQIEDDGRAPGHRAIAAVPGLDAIFIGPADLAASMGRLGDIAHPEVRTLLHAAVQVWRGRHAGGHPRRRPSSSRRSWATATTGSPSAPTWGSCSIARRSASPRRRRRDLPLRPRCACRAG